MSKNNHNEISGLVIEGDKKARELGFPTANIISSHTLESGIFAGRVSTIDGDFDAILYVSKRNPKMIEAHLFDFDNDIYGETIIIQVGKKIREDKVIKDIKELKEQIKQDTKNAKSLLAIN